MSYRAKVDGVGVLDGDVAAVVLDVDDRVLPIFVSADQAYSIHLGLRGQQFERPLTHDVFVDLVVEFGGAIDGVRIDALQDGTFYAKLDVDRYGPDTEERVVFDVRPSDGIAIAVRVDCPILVDEAVVEAAGRPADEVEFERFEESRD